MKTTQLHDHNSKQRHVWEHTTTQPVANTLAMINVKRTGKAENQPDAKYMGFI
jgi:hypothetical protein